MTNIAYEFGYLRITNQIHEIGFRVDDLKQVDRDALMRAVADIAPHRAAPKKQVEPSVNELAKRMGQR